MAENDKMTRDMAVKILVGLIEVAAKSLDLQFPGMDLHGRTIGSGGRALMELGVPMEQILHGVNAVHQKPTEEEQEAMIKTLPEDQQKVMRDALKSMKLEKELQEALGKLQKALDKPSNDQRLADKLFGNNPFGGKL